RASRATVRARIRVLLAPRIPVSAAGDNPGGPAGAGLLCPGRSLPHAASATPPVRGGKTKKDPEQVPRVLVLQQCRREDSNLPPRNGNQLLKLARLPIPPLRQGGRGAGSCRAPGYLSYEDQFGDVKRLLPAPGRLRPRCRRVTGPGCVPYQRRGFPF